MARLVDWANRVAGGRAARGSFTVVLLAALLFGWSHRHALRLTGFADDLGLLNDLPRLAATSGLAADVWARVTGPLWPQSAMWRPLPYASFALDATLWGAAPSGWHATNVLLHLAFAALTGLIGRDVAAALLARESAAATDTGALRARAALTGAVAFALCLLCPWAPEVTLWLVGRFDAWAGVWTLCALWLGMRGADRVSAAALSLFSASLAYASKESAPILLPWLCLTLLATRPWFRGVDAPARQAARWRWAAFVLAHALLLVSYLLWRQHLFSGAAAAVYGAAPQFSPSRWTAQIMALVAFPIGLAALAWPTALAVALAAVVQLTTGASRRLVWWQRSVGFAAALAVIAALALYIAAPPGANEGYRLYYLVAPGVAWALAATALIRTRWQWPVLLVLLCGCAHWQSRVAAEWTRVDRDLRAAMIALRDVGSNLPATDYGLVLMPDQSGHVPFARNAQGGLIWLAERGASGEQALAHGALLAHLILFTPPQLSEWQRLASDNVVAKLTPRIDAPPNPTRYYCFDRRSGRAQDLGFWPSAPADAWSRQWREKTAQACPDLHANWR